MLWPAKIAKLEGENATLTASLATATAENVALQERLTTLEASGEDSPALVSARAEIARLTSENTSLNSQLTAAFAENAAYKGAVGTEGLFTFGSDAAKPVIALTDAGKTRFINADVARTLATSGHAPLSLAVDTVPGATSDAPKLKGRERLRAATRAEFDSKKP